MRGNFPSVLGLHVMSFSVFPLPFYQNYFRKSPYVQYLIVSKKLYFIVNFKCMFQREFQYFSVKFLSFANHLCLIYKHLHCSYIYYLPVSNLF